MKELVSIVLPVYNGEAYIRESIDSVLNQTYNNWELIIIDDCSTDSTAKIVDAYANADNRIKYYKNEKNLRLPRSLNRGFSLAAGEYLTWTSDDNLFLPTAIERMIEQLKSKSADFVFCAYDIIDENGNFVSSVSIPCEYEDMIVGSNVVGACFMYTRNVYNTVGDYQHGLLLVEDYDYWQKVFAKHKVTSINHVLYKYRKHSASLTGKSDVRITNRAYQESIMSNRILYSRFNLAKKYYYYYGLYRCSKSFDSKKYFLRYQLYKILYTYPQRLRRKLNGKNK